MPGKPYFLTSLGDGTAAYDVSSGAYLTQAPSGGTAALSWAASDWDSSPDSTGMVHDSLADHAGNATVHPGYSLGSLTEDMADYYPLDAGSGTTATDAAGSNDGTISGATWNGSGQVGADCLSFDGTDDYVSLPDLGLGSTQPFTIAYWMSLTSIPGMGVMYTHFGRYDGTDDIIYLQTTETGKCQFRLGHANGLEIDIESASTLTSGTWYHLAATWNPDTTTATFYLDGVEDASASASIDDFATTGGPHLGRRSDGTNYHDGAIDDVRIYDRALNPVEVDALASLTQPSTVTAGDSL